MRLAIVLSHINKSTQWSCLSQEYKKIGLNHYFIILNEYPTLLEKDLLEIGIPVYFFKTKNKFSLFLVFLKVLIIFIKHRPNIVHTSLPYGNFIGQLAALTVFVKKRITTCENASWAHDYKNFTQTIIDKFTFKTSKKIIATCETSKNYLIESWNIKSQKIEILNQALNPDDYQNISLDKIKEFRLSHGIEEKNFVIGVVARFELWKGHKYIIDAVQILKSKIPNLKVIIVGSKGQDYDTIMELINQMKLNNIISHLGFIENLPLFFKTISIHIHVPVNEHVETFGLNIIEGMMAECPQILTKSGIASTTAKNHYNCLLVDYCNHQQISEAVLLYFNNPELRKRLAHNAKKDAIDFFNMDRKVEKSLKIYNSL